jgi:hypothetical protein
VIPMNTNRQVPLGSLALVVMAAGTVTASPEFAAEKVGEFTPIRLPDIPLKPGDTVSSHGPAARR